MQDLTSLYSKFKISLEKDSCSDLCDLEDSEFWEELSCSERVRLAKLFLKRGRDALLCEGNEDLFFSSAKTAEKIASKSAEIFCLQAIDLFDYGTNKDRIRCFVLALHKIGTAFAVEPSYFNNTTRWWRLWGTMLISLGKHFSDTSFFVKAEEKYRRAEELLLDGVEVCPSMYWDWGEVWCFLGAESKEVSDFQKAIEKYSQALELGCSNDLFLVDYGRALVALGELSGKASYIQTALDFFKQKIQVACGEYAKASKLLSFMTGREEDFKNADKAFHDAIISDPKDSQLWLEWGDLFLRYGWLSKSIKHIETAIDKLTASKIKNCDPEIAGALLADGLVKIGIFLEDVKLIKEVQTRLDILSPNGPRFFYVEGLVYLGLGFYFSDSKYLLEAKNSFQKAIDSDSSFVFSWHGIYQVNIALGELEKDTSFIDQGISAARRLVELFPFNSSYWNNLGIALMKLAQLEPNIDKQELLVEEAISKFSEAIELGEGDLEFSYNYGCALDYLGEITEDESCFLKSIEVLSGVLDKDNNIVYTGYHLALALLHYGELTQDTESLYNSVDLFETILKIDKEDEMACANVGLALLHIADLFSDPIYPDKKKELLKRAEVRLVSAAKLGNKDVLYYLACLYSIEGSLESSMEYLRLSEQSLSLTDVEDLDYDEWLYNVRQTQMYKEFVRDIRGG